jgi:hypothetical protein
MFSQISRSVMDMPLQIDRNGSRKQIEEEEAPSIEQSYQTPDEEDEVPRQY